MGGLFFAGSYNLYLALWYRECGLLGSKCDLLTNGVDDAFLRRLRDLNLFERIMRNDFPIEGRLTCHDYIDRKRAVIDGQNRVQRARHRLDELLTPGTLFGDGKKEYETLWIGFPRIPKDLCLLYSQLAKTRLSLHFWEHSLTYYQEDGEGWFSYDHFEGMNSLWEGVNSSARFARCEKKYFLFKPEMANKALKASGAEIVRVPCIDPRASGYVKNINILHDYAPETDAAIRQCDGIILGTYFNLMGGIPSRLEAVYEGIAARVGENRVLFKDHPGGPKTVFSRPKKWTSLEERHMPFEVLLANHAPFDDSLFVSPCVTTVLVSAVFRFGYEPYILCFSPCFPELFSEKQCSMDRFWLETLRKCYRRPEKILLAENEGAIWDFMKFFCGGRSGVS